MFYLSRFFYVRVQSPDEYSIRFNITSCALGNVLVSFRFTGIVDDRNNARMFLYFRHLTRAHLAACSEARTLLRITESVAADGHFLLALFRYTTRNAFNIPLCLL